MSTCVVEGCNSKSSQGSSIRFYSIPENPSRRELWLSKIQIKTDKEVSTVCGLHFRPQDFDEWYRLRHDAVPVKMEGCWRDGSSQGEEVCRICLASCRKMYDLRDNKLEQAYNDVTGLSINDGLPIAICWECKGRVISASRVRDRARTAHGILLDMLHRYGSITIQNVLSVDRREHKIASQLSEKYIKPNDFIHINEVQLKDISDIISNKESNNIAYKESDTIAYKESDTTEYKESNTPDKEEIVVNNTKIIEDDFVNFDDADHFDDNMISVDIKHDENNDTDVESNDSKTIVVSTNYAQDKNDKNDVVIEKKSGRKSKLPRARCKRKSKDEDTVSKRKTPEYMKDFTVTKFTKEEEIAEIQKRKDSNAYKEAAYKCDVCYRGYIVKSFCEEHILKHTEKYGTVECEICRIRKPTLKEIRTHMKISHGKRYSCNQCSFQTQSQLVAKNHHRHHSKVTYDCPHCSQQFTRMTTYYGHLRKKHLCDCPCEYCGHTFLSEKGKVYHQKSTHRFDKDSMALSGPHCATCDVTFATKDAHDTHLTMSSRHNDDNTSQVSNTYRLPSQKRGRPRGSQQPVFISVTCEQCGQVLPTKKTYVAHFEKEHPGQTRTQHLPINPSKYRFMCEHCGRKFSGMATLKEHMPVHSGVRGFECPVCGKKFVKKPSLDSHLTIHSAQRETFHCGVCQKPFTNRASRHKHMKSSHANVKPYECEACGKRFVVPSLLRAHVDHVHNKVPWPKRNRRRVNN